MRKFLLPLFFLAFCLICSQVFTNQGGPPTGVAGDPPFNETCAAAGCHTGSPLNSGGGSVSITVLDSSLNSVTSYIPKKVYTLVFSITEGTKTRYGFESCIFKSSNVSIGTLAVIDAVKTRVLGGTKKWAQHTSSGTDFTTGTATWQMKWTAPNSNEGNATIYAAFNAANKDGTTGGDKIYTHTLVLTGTGSSGIATAPDEPYFQNNGNMILVNAPEGSQISIFDLNGSCVTRSIAGSGKTAFFTSALSPGIYIVSVRSVDTESFYKFVKP